MRISRITIVGFRGFNDSQDIPLNPRLTLISAPNSYGKTSISEALEWIINGITSKVSQADSKDEYKGSYRNIHLPAEQNPSVTLLVNEGEKNCTLKAELVADAAKKFYDGVEVAEWPFSAALSTSPSPFVLQHALKDLLLAAPGQRFDSFARLLGVTELGQIHKDLISLCTKPPFPPKVSALLADVRSLEERLAGRAQFAQIAKALRKGIEDFDVTYVLIEKKCKEFIPPETPRTSMLSQLLQVRDRAVKKIFSGTVTLDSFSAEEEASNTADEEFVARALTAKLIDQYASLVKLKAIKHVSDLLDLFGIGNRLLEENPAVCPLCERMLEKGVRVHIQEKHGVLVERMGEYCESELTRKTVERLLNDLHTRLEQHYNRLTKKIEAFIALDLSLEDLRSLLTVKHPTHFEAISRALVELTDARAVLERKYNSAKSEIEIVQASISASQEGTEKITRLSTAISEYLGAADTFEASLKSHSVPVKDAAQVLKYELDSLAGTQDVSVLIDLIEKRLSIRKKFLIEGVVDELKGLRQRVDKFVSQIMLDAISGEFGTEVMEWYGKIKTAGDPDVHFAGFDMKRTAQGGRVQIKARSYDKDLVSAVSSLSESKLNALGLCISFAINTKAPGPFDFLVVDDPIQSWDAEHETKFIEVVKELVARKKQVILFSHNDKWIKQVRVACAELNGTAYEITSYTKAGPCIIQIPWAEVEQRLATIKGIIDNPQADKIMLQQGEEEVRQVVTELAAELYFRTTGRKKNTNNLNASKTKELLLAGGISSDLTNRLISSFETVDDAHHAAPDYSADRSRLRAYYDWLKNLQNEVKSKR